MATRTVVGSTPTPSRPSGGLASAPITEFRTHHEVWWLAGAPEDNPAALMINPAATRASLDAAVRLRVEALAVLLGILEGVEQEGMDLGQRDALTPLAALASELRILVAEAHGEGERHA